MFIWLPFPPLIPIIENVIVSIFWFKSCKNIFSLALNTTKLILFCFFYDTTHVIWVISQNLWFFCFKRSFFPFVYVYCKFCLLFSLVFFDLIFFIFCNEIPHISRFLFLWLFFNLLNFFYLFYLFLFYFFCFFAFHFLEVGFGSKIRIKFIHHHVFDVFHWIIFSLILTIWLFLMLVIFFFLLYFFFVIYDFV